MQCRSCRAWNDGEEVRCVRCGRRMQLAAPQSAPDTYPITTAAVPVFETFQGGNAGGGNAEGGPSAGAAAAPAPDVNYQASLFRDPLSAKVVPIPTLTSSREVQRDAAPRRAPRSASPRTSGRRASLSHRDSQQRLDFEVLSPLDTQMEAVISCDAPVALPSHRMIAAAMDLSIVVIALGVCFGIFLVAGSAASFSRQNLPLFLGVGVALEVLYRLLWVLGNGDSPGL